MRYPTAPSFKGVQQQDSVPNNLRDHCPGNSCKKDCREIYGTSLRDQIIGMRAGHYRKWNMTDISRLLTNLP